MTSPAHIDALQKYNAFLECEDTYISLHIKSALSSILDTIRLFGPEMVFSSFNGGKDAVVVMHLLRAAVAKYSEDTGTINHPRLVYFDVPDEFPEILSYIDWSVSTYDLDLRRFDCGIVEVIDVPSVCMYVWVYVRMCVRPYLVNMFVCMNEYVYVNMCGIR